MVLIDGILDRLGKVALQFRRRDRQSIQKRHQIDGIFVMQRIAHLAHHPQPVCRVTDQNTGFIAKAGLNWANASGCRSPIISRS